MLPCVTIFLSGPPGSSICSKADYYHTGSPSHTGKLNRKCVCEAEGKQGDKTNKLCDSMLMYRGGVKIRTKNLNIANVIFCSCASVMPSQQVQALMRRSSDAFPPHRHPLLDFQHQGHLTQHFVLLSSVTHLTSRSTTPILFNNSVCLNPFISAVLSVITKCTSVTKPSL